MDGGRIGNNVEKYGKREDGAEKKEEVEKEIDGEIERKKSNLGRTEDFLLECWLLLSGEGLKEGLVFATGSLLDGGADEDGGG